MSTQPAEIVFCDVIMPVHDGVWLAQQIRERWPQTVIVAVSGAQEMATVVKMRQFGAVDFVPKPIGREMLHQALERALATLEARGPAVGTGLPRLHFSRHGRTVGHDESRRRDVARHHSGRA